MSSPASTEGPFVMGWQQSSNRSSYIIVALQNFKMISFEKILLNILRQLFAEQSLPNEINRLMGKEEEV